MAAHHEIGRDAHGFGYGGTGMKSFQNNFEKYGAEYGVGDVIGCLLDLPPPAADLKGVKGGARATIGFSKNGASLGTAFTLPQGLLGSVFFPALVRLSLPLSLSLFLPVSPSCLSLTLTPLP